MGFPRAVLVEINRMKYGMKYQDRVCRISEQTELFCALYGLVAGM